MSLLETIEAEVQIRRAEEELRGKDAVRGHPGDHREVNAGTLDMEVPRRTGTEGGTPAGHRH